MKSIVNILEKVSASIYKVEKIILVLAVIVEVGVNFINVCLRYIMGKGLSFGETLSIVLFMVIILLGGNIAVKTDSEIKIDVFKFKSEKAMAVYKMVVELVCILALVWLFKGTVTVTQSALKTPSQVIPLPINTYHEYILMLIGIGLILLDHVILFLKRASVLVVKEG